MLCSLFQVNPGSIGSVSGLREGDLISAINGVKTETLTKEEAKTLHNASKGEMRLQLNM